MDDAVSYFFVKAAQYRRLAGGTANQQYDLTRVAMLALADEFEAKARAAVERTKAAQEVAT